MIKVKKINLIFSKIAVLSSFLTFITLRKGHRTVTQPATTVRPLPRLSAYRRDCPPTGRDPTLHPQTDRFAVPTSGTSPPAIRFQRPHSHLQRPPWPSPSNSASLIYLCYRLGGGVGLCGDLTVLTPCDKFL